VPNKDVLLNYLKERNLSAQTEEGQDAALKLIESEIGQFKAGGAFAGEFPERWLPAAVAVLGEGFTEQNQFLNSTLKMVRGKITEFYRDRIDYLFTADGKDFCNPQNRMIIKRMG
jgi:long-chain acyl-CoA synthetase